MTYGCYYIPWSDFVKHVVFHFNFIYGIYHVVRKMLEILFILLCNLSTRDKLHRVFCMCIHDIICGVNIDRWRAWVVGKTSPARCCSERLRHVLHLSQLLPAKCVPEIRTDRRRGSVNTRPVCLRPRPAPPLWTRYDGREGSSSLYGV